MKKRTLLPIALAFVIIGLSSIKAMNENKEKKLPSNIKKELITTNRGTATLLNDGKRIKIVLGKNRKTFDKPKKGFLRIPISSSDTLIMYYPDGKTEILKKD